MPTFVVIFKYFVLVFERKYGRNTTFQGKGCEDNEVLVPSICKYARTNPAFLDLMGASYDGGRVDALSTRQFEQIAMGWAPPPLHRPGKGKNSFFFDCILFLFTHFHLIS